MDEVKERYGKNEYRYALPIADALVADQAFKNWFLGRTVFAQHRQSAMLLSDLQKQTRGATAENWWRSYWIGSSYKHSDICGQRETDLLAIFEVDPSFRFAVHVEVKAPGDSFRLDQASDYKKRAECWAGRDRAPWSVVPHDASTTVICCPATFAINAAPQLAFFETVLTFEEIAGELRGGYPSEN